MSAEIPIWEAILGTNGDTSLTICPAYRKFQRSACEKLSLVRISSLICYKPQRRDPARENLDRGANKHPKKEVNDGNPAQMAALLPGTLTRGRSDFDRISPF